MSARKMPTGSVPKGSAGGFRAGTPPRKVLRAGPEAVRVWREMVDEAEREQALAARAAARAEARAVEVGLLETERTAKRRGESVTRRPGGPLEVGRDGLKWLYDKGTILRPHYQAGLRFRQRYEFAGGTGVLSSLGDPGVHTAFGPKTGPSMAMADARIQLREDLRALGTPLLEPYVNLIAGEGMMLTDPHFVKDARRVSEHTLPVRIAFDLLARHYGMIR